MGGKLQSDTLRMVAIVGAEMISPEHDGIEGIDLIQGKREHRSDPSVRKKSPAPGLVSTVAQALPGLARETPAWAMIFPDTCFPGKPGAQLFWFFRDFCGVMMRGRGRVCRGK
jgi:hypothetical protein